MSQSALLALRITLAFPAARRMTPDGVSELDSAESIQHSLQEHDVGTVGVAGSVYGHQLLVGYDSSSAAVAKAASFVTQA
jgi:hypothetical protein